MRYIYLFLTLLFLSNALCSQELKFENLPFNKNIKENILKGKIFSESIVTSIRSNNTQSLKFSIAGIHPKSCMYALKTLSVYEEYSHYLDFVTESKYNEQSQEIDLVLSHFLLPYDMALIFKLPRIKIPGVYPFTFDIGILKNLHGKIYVIEHSGKCLFYSNAEWNGKNTGFPNMMFEVFSQALSKLSMDALFRISKSLRH